MLGILIQRMSWNIEGATRVALTGSIIRGFNATVVLLCAILLLLFSERLSALVVKEDSAWPTFSAEDWLKEVFILSLKILGVIALINGLSGPVQLLETLFWLNRQNNANVWRPHFWQVLSSSMSWVLLFPLSFYLIFGGKRIVDFAFRNRSSD